MLISIYEALGFDVAVFLGVVDPFALKGEGWRAM